MQQAHDERRKPLQTREALRARAEAKFKFREQQKADAPVAVREYRDAQQAIRDRTARLKAERLACETGRKL